jgi:hypothetical protein
MEVNKMANSFNFNTVKPKTMTVTLSDEKKTVLIVKTPDKKLMNELVSLNKLVADMDDVNAIDAIYDLASKVLSRNVNGIKITTKKLNDLYDDVSYITAFLVSYTNFVKALSNEKN